MDHAEAEELYRRYFPIIREKCSRMLSDRQDAQDIAQETFARLWSQRARLERPEAATAWIYRTSTRLAIDRLRGRRRRGQGPAEAEASPASDPERQAGARQWLERIGARVPPRELEVLVLTRIDRLTQAEAAEVMRVSERTVRRLLDRAGERLGRWRRAEESA